MYRIISSLLTVLLAGTAAAQGLDLPSTFDLRNIDGHSYIGDVRDQGQCGSCWSFGTLAAAESVWNRTHNLYDDQAIDFSEAFMVWSLSPLYDGMEGCNGAMLEDPMDALLDYGVPLESDFPYTITDPGDDLHWDATRYTFSAWYSIPTNDIETTKRVLNSIGVVTGAMLVEDAFYAYEDGVYEDENRGPQYTDLAGDMNHAISLVGWNDDPGDDGMGTWILRNSWSAAWGDDGYAGVRYTSARTNLWGEYVMLDPWDGQDTTVQNSGVMEATPWSAGGTLNAHGVDLWGSPASRVVNSGEILAEAVATDELVTGRGVYLWGGTGGQVINTGHISGFAGSQTNQAIAYAICFQGGSVQNQGTLSSEAQSPSELALAFGLWASNGTEALEVANSGQIDAQTGASDDGFAYGILASSRSMTTLINSGTVSATANYRAVGIYIQGGSAWLQNSGTITADAKGIGIGALLQNGSTVLRNSGTIGGSLRSIYGRNAVSGTEPSRVSLVLDTGSNLIGTVQLAGDTDQLILTGTGSEDDIFIGVESLTMDGADWSLSGDSDFDTIAVAQGRLGIDGDIGGDTTIGTNGILGGTGTLWGQIDNFGTIAPGHSVGHLTINGDFAQDTDGTLEIEIGDAQADQLTVTGTASLAGTLLVLPDGYATGGSYTFVDANSIDGGFDTVQSAAILDTELSTAAPDSLSLDVTRNSYESLASRYNLSLAETLDDTRATAADDFGDLLGTLDMALTPAELDASLSELTPRIHGLASALAMENTQDRFDTLRRRMDQVDPPSPNDESDDKTDFWFDVPGQYARYRADGAYPGAKETLSGLMFGVERYTDYGLKLGAAAAATESNYDLDGSADAGENRMLQGYLYGLWCDPRDSDGWHLGAAFGIGTTQFEADRVISFAGRKTNSTHDGRIAGGTLQAGRNWTRGRWKLGLTLGASYLQLQEDAFEESGADSADLDVRSRRSDSFQGFLGGRLARSMVLGQLPIEPALRVQWRHEFQDDSEPLVAALADSGDYFSTPGRDPARDSLLIGAGLGVQLSQFSVANLRYDCKLQDDHGATHHTLHFQATLRF